MNAGLQLIDKYAETCQIKLDKEIAARLKVTKATVSGWRHGKAHPNAAAVQKMCRATGEPLTKWLPLIESERCRTPDDRKAWLNMLQSVAACLIIALPFSRLDVQTIQVQGAISAGHNMGTLYIM